MTPNNQNNLEKIVGLTVSYFQTYYKPTIQYQHPDRYVDQWNRVENLETLAFMVS